jgi:hypothetical protein
MKDEEYEVTTHYKIGCDTVEIYDSDEMLNLVNELYDGDDSIIGLTIYKV